MFADRVEQWQQALYAWALDYYTNRTRSGKYYYTLTSRQTFQEFVSLTKEKCRTNLHPRPHPI